MKTTRFALKSIIIIIMGCVPIGCRVQHGLYDLVLYQSAHTDVIKPNYIILHPQKGCYEYYWSTNGDAIIGAMDLINDTLLLTPQIICTRNLNLTIERNLIVYKVDTMTLNETTIPCKFIVNKDALIDITDYNILPCDTISENIIYCPGDNKIYNYFYKIRTDMPSTIFKI